MSDCILWTGPLGKEGYGSVWNSRRRQTDSAHRLAWERAYGPIPSGLVIDHLCRNRACVNVDHMEVVTNRVNILRGAGLAAHNAVARACKNGHPFDAANTYVPPDGRRRVCRTCNDAAARRYRARLSRGATDE